MPRRDGTGPVQSGLMNGRGFGFCAGMNAVKHGVGLGIGEGLACRRGRGYGRCAATNMSSYITQKELLQEQKNVLQSRIRAIDMQLEST